MQVRKHALDVQLRELVVQHDTPPRQTPGAPRAARSSARSCAARLPRSPALSGGKARLGCEARALARQRLVPDAVRLRRHPRPCAACSPPCTPGSCPRTTPPASRPRTRGCASRCGRGTSDRARSRPRSRGNSRALPRAPAGFRHPDRWSAHRAAARCRRSAAPWRGARGCARRRRARRSAAAAARP